MKTLLCIACALYALGGFAGACVALVALGAPVVAAYTVSVLLIAPALWTIPRTF